MLKYAAWSNTKFNGQKATLPSRPVTILAASRMNITSKGQCALTEAGTRFDRAARITQDKIVMPLAR